jgi:hypothetical protein
MSAAEMHLPDVDVSPSASTTVMLNLPAFCRTQPLADVVMHLSCALADVAKRKDISVSDATYVRAARKLLHEVQATSATPPLYEMRV